MGELERYFLQQSHDKKQEKKLWRYSLLIIIAFAAVMTVLRIIIGPAPSNNETKQRLEKEKGQIELKLDSINNSANEQKAPLKKRLDVVKDSLKTLSSVKPQNINERIFFALSKQRQNSLPKNTFIPRGVRIAR